MAESQLSSGDGSAVTTVTAVAEIDVVDDALLGSVKLIDIAVDKDAAPVK